MKNFIFSFAILALTSSASAQSTKSWVVKVNPLGALFGSASLGIEKSLSTKSSIVVLPTFGGFKLGDSKYKNFGLGLEYRIYGGGEAPKGLYFAPGLKFTSGTLTTAGFLDVDDNGNIIPGSTYSNKFTTFGGKIVGGKQWIMGNGFVIDLNGGVGYRKFSYKERQSALFALKTGGITPELSFSLGYNF